MNKTIGILDIDCHGAKKKWGATIYPNLALCKIAAYHKAQGDLVEWATPMNHYDILYRSKIFNFTPDDTTIYDADMEVRGGTGYDVRSTLPQEIDDMQPDISIYPNMPTDTSYGFLTRGCPNKCAWCVVPRKEGAIRPYWDIDRVANGRKKVVLMDNNILASGDYCLEQLRKIIDRGYVVDFNQALDARLITNENAALLSQIKWIDRRIRFGCDTPQQVFYCHTAIRMLNGNGFKGQYLLYTMLNANFKESFNRLKHWWGIEQDIRSGSDLFGRNHIYCAAQPFRDTTKPNDPPQWQKDMAQWVNKRQLYTSITFGEFSPRKGFKCQTYIDTLLYEPRTLS